MAETRDNGYVNDKLLKKNNSVMFGKLTYRSQVVNQWGVRVGAGQLSPQF